MIRDKFSLIYPRWLPLLAVLGLTATAGLGEVATLGEVEGTDVSLPWHAANVAWSFEKSEEPFESLSLDIHVDRDLPADCNLYISPIGGCRLNNIAFYGGLQTNINGWPSREKQTRVHRGFGGIFSRWGKGSLSPYFARGAADSLYESAGYEGDFVSVRRPLAWAEGTHTWSLRKLDTEREGEEVWTWFGCFVTNHQSGRTTFVGSLRFEGETFHLHNAFSAFVEVYWTTVVPHGKVPEVNVAFGIPRVNGREVRLKSVRAIYPNRGAAASPDIARVVVENNRPVVQLSSRTVKPDVPRNHALAIVQDR